MDNADSLLVRPGYTTVYNAIVEPGKVFTISRYFIRYWLPLLNPSLAWIIIALQQRCYRNARQNWCIVPQEDLGGDVGLDRTTVNRHLSTPEAGWFVQSAHQYTKREGKKERTWSKYEATVDMPLIPYHINGLAAILRGTDPNQALPTLTDDALPHGELLARVDEASQGAPHLNLGAVRKSVKSVIESVFGVEVVGETHRLCDKLHSKITAGTYVGTQYFREKWVPILGPALAWLVVILRNSCYDNPETGEKRHECTWKKGDLAAALGQSTVNLRLLLASRHASTFFEIVEQGHHWLAFKVAMWQEQEPLTAKDHEQLSMDGYSLDPVTGQLGFGDKLMVPAGKPKKMQLGNRKKCDLGDDGAEAGQPENPENCNSGDGEPKKMQLRNRRNCNSGDGEPKILQQHEVAQTENFATTYKHLLSTPEEKEAQQQQHCAAAAESTTDEEPVEPESLAEPPDRPPPDRPGGEQPPLDKPADVRQEELPEPGRPSPDRPGGEQQPSPGRSADAQPGEGDAGQWLAKLQAVRKRRDQANVLHRMCRALLAQEIEHRTLGRLAKQHGAVAVANAILRCAEDGDDAGLERIVQILEGSAAGDSAGDSPEPPGPGAGVQHEPGAQAESGRGGSPGRGGAGSGPPVEGDMGAGGDGPPGARGDAGPARRGTRKRAAAGGQCNGDDELLAVLREAGVQPPNLGRLLEKPGLTAQDARAWLLYAHQEGGLDKPVGFAISRMLAGDEPPEDFRLLAGLDERSRDLFWENLARLEDYKPLCALPDAGLAEKFVAWAGMRGFGESAVRQALQWTTGKVARDESRPADERPLPHEEAWGNALALLPSVTGLRRVFEAAGAEFAPDGDGGGVVRLSMNDADRVWVENRGALRHLVDVMGMAMPGWRVELAEAAECEAECSAAEERLREGLCL